LLCRGFERLDHLMAPGIAVVGVREGTGALGVASAGPTTPDSESAATMAIADFISTPPVEISASIDAYLERWLNT
jgi:hypothetical protein